MIPVFQILIALGLDALLGEPRRWHPLIGFGRLAQGLEARSYGRPALTPWQRRLRGLLAWSLLVLPPVVLTAWLMRWAVLDWVLGTGLLYLALGRQSLARHASVVATALAVQDLSEARQRVGWMVSRDTRALDAPGISRATVESVLENGNDAVFGALFWFVLLGAPGVVLYRLANTLDAMWGYRNDRYAAFGWAAARIDDGLNWIPARLTALAYAMAGKPGPALACWRRQARHWVGRNAGTVMAAGAGALQLQLGGPAVYHGVRKRRPLLGTGRKPEARDIGRSTRFVDRALALWLGVLLAGGLWLA